MKSNVAGLVAVVFLAMSFVVPSLHRPVFYLAVQVFALRCSIIAVHGSRKWLPLIAVSALLTTQAIVAAVIEG
jgi:hypothetical protein